MTEFCTVTHHLTAFKVDGPDADRDPDRAHVQGRLTLTPLVPDGHVEVDEVSATTLVIAPIEVPIVDGAIRWRGEQSVRVVAGIDWRASWSDMQSDGWPFTLSPIRFTAPAGGTIDLSEVRHG
ncbi:hypothetical protein PQI66_09725 [Corynebacterium sp. USCH3]|uniref:hypothetical protein n=1 Tax=Corynebacterium sp. USCH3 TaxID=3024840 RepID=UPI0030A9A6FA